MSVQHSQAADFIGDVARVLAENHGLLVLKVDPHIDYLGAPVRVKCSLGEIILMDVWDSLGDTFRLLSLMSGL